MLGFGGAILYTERSGSKLDAAAASIATNGAPAIEHLTAARDEIMRIRLEAAAAIQRPGGGATTDRTAFDTAFARLQRDLSAYLGLPFYPGERDQYAGVDQATHALQAQIASFLARVAARDMVGARSVVRGGVSQAAANLDQALDRLIVFNLGQQRRLATEIPRIRDAANRVGNILEAITAILGMTLMLLVVRAARRYSRILDERRHLAEVQATVAVALSRRLEAIGKATVSIAEAITSRSPLQATFEVVAEEARAVIAADYCALGFGSDPERPFEPWAFSGMTAADAQAIGRNPRPVGLLGAVPREGRAIRIDDLTQHPEFRALPEHHPPMGPFLGIPLIHQDRHVGNLYLARRPGQPSFTDDDEHAGTLLAAYIGVAADNARLYSEAQTAIRAREDLLATVSHDLKNPLNAIRLSSEVLRRSVGEGDAADLAARIDRATNRMLQMIGDLLDAAKIEAGHLRAAGQPEDVTSLVDEAVEMFSPAAAEKSIELSRHTPSSPVAVLCERALLLRVFSNLIGNAIKFTPRSGAVSVAAETLSGEVHFTVTDTGPGISADRLGLIFDRYWQQKDSDRRGSGLGLYIVKGIVQAHAGRIWAESTLGEGTRIHFVLPAYHAAQRSTP